MLAAVVDAFAQGVRRDLFLVPVSIHYGRVVEEDAYQRELGGGEKEPESLAGLVRARRVLSRRHGTVYITFADPISLNEALGERKDAFRHQQDPETLERKRRFVQKLGFRLAARRQRRGGGRRDLGVGDRAAQPCRTAPCRLSDFVTRGRALARYLRARGVRFTASLERNDEGEFRENLGFLENGGLIQRLSSEGRSVIYVPAEKRLALDFYKNNTHPLLPAAGAGRSTRWRAGCAVRRCGRRGVVARPAALGVSAAGARCAQLPSSTRPRPTWSPMGALERRSAARSIRSTRSSCRCARMLDNFREAYWIAAQALLELPDSRRRRRRPLLERMQKRYRTGLLLGEVRKPEGNSSVTLGNALNRFAELDCVQVRVGKGKDRLVTRGAQFGAPRAIAERIGAGVVGVLISAPWFRATPGVRHAPSGRATGRPVA